MSDSDLERDLRAHLTHIANQAPRWAAVDAPTRVEPTGAPRSWPRITLAAAAVAAVVVGAAAVVESGLSDPPTSTAPVAVSPAEEPAPSPDEAMQMRLQSTAEHFSAFERAEGYGKTVIDAKEGEIRVFWHGEVPAEVEDLVAEHSTGDISVQLVAATYSDAQLQAAADVVWKTANSPGLEVVATYPSRDMSALVVEVVAGDEARAQSQLDSQVGDLGIPLVAVVTGEAMPR